jgi:microcystin-dependent protein
MATITGLTAARMQEIEAASVIDGDIVAGHLILTKHDGTQIDAGPVAGPAGPPGPAGPQGLSAIPGEVKLWPSGVLPELATWGKWVWADGAAYDVATYPVAASHIAAAWKTFDGVSDPGAGKFRVPDLRGLIPAGLDQMPTGARANRMTRTAAITLAAKTGKETHQLAIGEMPSHNHGGATGAADRPLKAVMAGSHSHEYIGGAYMINNAGATFSHSTGGNTKLNATTVDSVIPAGGAHEHTVTDHLHGIGTQGSDNVHENVQPSVMVPYIVCLGG